ncbi:unnamed protein product [Medioppia subpectinata]|uniref:C2H2-type domain-containing protein n=1 Tax=Medioppia subpectinata TaxID=1979941 RepID=A0A7R9KLB9_9ACAR|nr:unnamed protein product [Medioppia subpectinata]CAG2105735.1 unnamed protein product [Medioppia subpectinata]
MDELTEERNRLAEDKDRLSRRLAFSEKYIELMLNYRKCLITFDKHCVCDENSLNKFVLTLLEKEFHTFEDNYRCEPMPSKQSIGVQTEDNESRGQEFSFMSEQINCDHMLTADNSVGHNSDHFNNDSVDRKEIVLPLMTSQLNDECLIPETRGDYEVAVPVVVTNSTPILITRPKPANRAKNKPKAKSTQSGINDGNATDQFKCPKIGCYLSFSSQFQLNKHLMSAHPNARPYRCPYCPKAYKLWHHLKQHHNRTHANDHQRGDRLSTDDERQHFSRCRLDDGSGFRCDWPDCQQVISRFENFRGHMRTHRCDYRFPCDECDKRYVDYQRLVRHQRSAHNRSVDFECHFADCHYKTVHKYRLNMHLMKHSQQKAFKCRINGCKSSFNLKRNLNLHKDRKHGLNRVKHYPSEQNSIFMSQLLIN